MTMKKYGDSQKLEVAYVGEEARVVNAHLQKVGKPLSEFNKQETEALKSELRSVSPDDNLKESEESGADPEGDKDE